MSTADSDMDNKAVIEGIKVIENRNLMSVFWIFVSCSGIFTLIQYWPTNNDDCISLARNFGPESCGIFVFTTYVIQPFLYCGLLMSLIFINFDVIDEDDQNPIEIKIENENDKEIQLELKQQQSSVRLPQIHRYRSSDDVDYDDDNDDDDDSHDYNANNDEVHEEFLWDLMKEQTSKCEELLFPICILTALIIIEIFVVLYSPNLWYTIQIFSDFFGYLLWLFYTAIITKLKFEHKIEHSKTKMLNYFFLAIAMISLCIMTYAILQKDSGFNELREHGVPQMGFVQVIVESTLLLELISIVIENLLHIYCTCFHHSYHPIHDAPDVSHLLGNTKAIFVFILFGTSQIVIGSIKTLQDGGNRVCSNFTLMVDNRVSDCYGYFWLIQLIINVICLGVIMSQFTCNCHILTLEYLVFPLIIGICMILCQFMFLMNSGNEFYFVQIFIDITGYIVLFMEGLYALRFFMYIKVHSSWIALKRGMDKNIKYMIGSVNRSINLKLLFIFIGMIVCLLAAVLTLILNFYTDVDKIEDSASFLQQIGNKDERYEIGVEQWMFLVLVFENTLIIEYIRILAASIDIHIHSQITSDVV